MKENVLVVGSGAREHALVWKMAQSLGVNNVFCAPGNPGIAKIAETSPIKADDPSGLLKYAQRIGATLTVVGPENALEKGVVDVFRENGLRIFGPSSRAARLECSKACAKDFMARYGIPTAYSEIFTPDSDANLEAFLEKIGPKAVVKKDGLAIGKGVSVFDNPKDALDVGKYLLKRGEVIVVEEFLEGIEVSTTALCNGRNFIPMCLTMDHKQLYEGGPNTGGMGVITPLPFIDQKSELGLWDITQKTLDAYTKEGMDFKGVLYPNMMLTRDGLRVLEYNTRFGDPEAQALMVLLCDDIVDIFHRVIDGEMDSKNLTWLKNKYATCLTLASGGYPDPQKLNLGNVIEGIADAEKIPGVRIFHAGTKMENGKLVNSGGRVLSVVSTGESLDLAVRAAYYAASKINFEGMYVRPDIAKPYLKAA